MKKEDLKTSGEFDNLCVEILRYIAKYLISIPYIILLILVMILLILIDLVVYPCLAIGYIFYAMYKFGEKEEIMSYKEFVKSAHYDGFIYNWLKDNVFKK